jgi:dihydroneopterin aldolase
VDLELRVDGKADHTDRVSDTVDYGAVATLATQIGTTEKAHTVERLAQLIGERILADHPLVASLWISVAKPFPPAPVIAEQAGVELELTRD